MNVQEIKSFEDKDYEGFLNMFYNYFVYDFQIQIDKSKIELICLDILDSVKKQISILDILKIHNKPEGFIIYQIDSPESDWCQKEGFGFIRELYISKELRNQGIGKLLVNHAEEMLMKKNVECIYLTSDGGPSFWNRCGYSSTDELGYRNEDPIYIKKLNS